MTVTIQLSPDQQQRLLQRAAANGQDVTQYVQQLIKDDIGEPTTPPEPPGDPYPLRGSVLS